MSGYYCFSIHYKGQKASRLQPAGPPNDEICGQFKQELAELGVNLPKTENIHIHTPGSISLVLFRDEDAKESNISYQRYLTVETSQNADPRVIDAKKKHSMVHILLSGPSTHSPKHKTTHKSYPGTSSGLQSKPAPMPPSMSTEYRFTITYNGGKARRLTPGTISSKEICAIFKADLRAFKIDQPKDETIQLDQRGSVSFTLRRYEDDNKNDVYESCMMLEMIQDRDPQIAGLKKERSIRWVSLAAEQKALAPKPQERPQTIITSKPDDKDQNNPGCTTSQVLNDTTEERSAKRMRYNHWFDAESPEPGQIVSSPASANPVVPSISTGGANSARMRFSEISADAGLPPTPVQTTPSRRYIKIEAPDDTLALAGIPLRYSPPPRARPSPRSRPPPYSHRRTLSSPMQPLAKASKINQLSQELWDTRRDISAAQERERRLGMEIEKLTGSRVVQPEVKSSQTESHQERNRRVDMELQLQAAQLKLEMERERRAAAEQSLKDVERECRGPFVVPALLKAFIKISELSSAAMDMSIDQPGR